MTFDETVKAIINTGSIVSLFFVIIMLMMFKPIGMKKNLRKNKN